MFQRGIEERHPLALGADEDRSDGVSVSVEGDQHVVALEAALQIEIAVDVHVLEGEGLDEGRVDHDGTVFCWTPSARKNP